LGCVVQEVALPTLREFMDAKTPISLAEIYAIHAADLRTRPDDFGHSLRWRVMPGVLVRADHYVRAMRWRRQLAARVLQHFADVDLMLTAAWYDSAPALVPDEPPSFIGSLVPSLSTPFNVTGMPAVALCNGFDELGLPLGMQIAGPPLAEAAVLACGHAFERATSYRQRRPPLRSDDAEQMSRPVDRVI
jgi:aspartyl-tRNA(Asn)/glutamyl-tRNA(Gln) amidotransferase subunit A